jgi:hypothetical protein
MTEIHSHPAPVFAVFRSLAGHCAVGVEVFIRKEGKAVIIEPKSKRRWPRNFFKKIRITDRTFSRPDHGRVCVTHQIALSMLSCQWSPCILHPLYSRRKTGDRTARGAFQFLLRNFLLQRILKHLL